MHRQKSLAAFVAIALLGSALAFVPVVAAAGGSGTTRQIPAAGTTSPVTGGFVPSSDGIASPEFAGEMDGGQARMRTTVSSIEACRAASATELRSRPARRPSRTPSSKPSFEGLNFYQQRYARGGNQFSVEPPDQALCVGNGYVVEAVNDVSTSSTPSGSRCCRTTRRPTSSAGSRAT